MKSYQLNDLDAAQVRAILRTHAEIQDQSSLRNEELRGRLSQEEADMDETIHDLKEIHGEISRDRDNLKRLADIFK